MSAGHVRVFSHIVGFDDFPLRCYARQQSMASFPSLCVQRTWLPAVSPPGRVRGELNASVIRSFHDPSRLPWHNGTFAH